MHNLYNILLIALIILIVPAFSFAGPNSLASCAIDMDISTTDYNFSGIENSASVLPDQLFYVAVVVQNVHNLDTYQLDISYDPEVLNFEDAVEDDPVAAGLTNILKKNNGNTLGFYARNTQPGKINIANTLIGRNTDQAPEGSGILCILTFKRLKSEQTVLSLNNVYFIDSSRQKDVIDKKLNGYIDQ